MANPFTPTQTGNYEVCPVYTGKDAAATNAVYLLPPAYTFGQILSVTVPLVYRGDASFANYRYVNDDFAFTFAANPDYHVAPPHPTVYPLAVNATVMVSANNLWKAAPAARKTFMDNFALLVQELERQFENAATPVLAPGASGLIGQQLAERLPAQLAETLYFRFGFTPGLLPGTVGAVNLQPGMRLRVEPEAAQFTSPGAATNGYVASGQLYYGIASIPDPNDPTRRKLAFDPFLGAVAAPDIPLVAGTPNTIASGVIDLQKRGMARRHWRLLTPQSMVAGNSAGDLGLAKNAVLIGADTRADLAAATTAYATSGMRAPDGATPPIVYALFRGRAAVVPEIAVTVAFGGGSRVEYVPVGTTVGNLLERYLAFRPLAVDQRVVTLRRPMTSPSLRSVGYAQVGFNNLTYGLPVNDLRAFDLPLLRGDLVTVAVGDSVDK